MKLTKAAQIKILTQVKNKKNYETNKSSTNKDFNTSKKQL